MSLLHDHFEKVRTAEQGGQKILRGVYFDLMGTLFYMDGSFNKSLIEFARWNHEKKLLGDNHLITGGSMGGLVTLEGGGFTTETTGVKTTEFKDYVFEEAREHQQRIALLIDDTNPRKKRWDDLVVTWWHPNDAGVREFLEKKEYLGFTP